MYIGCPWTVVSWRYQNALMKKNLSLNVSEHSSNILLQGQNCFCVGSVHVMNLKRDDAGPEEMSLVRLGIMSTCH